MIKDIEEYIPNFVKETEVEKLIKTELYFAYQFLKEIRSLNDNFDTISKNDLKQLELKSKYIAMWLSDFLGIFYTKTQTPKSLSNNITGILYALRHIGTDESFILLFKIFLNVDIEVKAPDPGVIELNLQGEIKTNIAKYIIGSGSVQYLTEKEKQQRDKIQGGYHKVEDIGGWWCRPETGARKKENIKKIRKLVVRQKQPDKSIKRKYLGITVFPEGYEHAFYSFIKKFIPIGRILKIKNKQGEDIQEFVP